MIDRCPNDNFILYKEPCFCLTMCFSINRTTVLGFILLLIFAENLIAQPTYRADYTSTGEASKLEPNPVALNMVNSNHFLMCAISYHFLEYLYCEKVRIYEYDLWAHLFAKLSSLANFFGISWFMDAWSTWAKNPKPNIQRIRNQAQDSWLKGSWALRLLYSRVPSSWALTLQNSIKSFENLCQNF